MSPGAQFPALIAKLFNENPNFKCVIKQPLLAYFHVETHDIDLEYNGRPLPNKHTS